MNTEQELSGLEFLKPIYGEDWVEDKKRKMKETHTIYAFTTISWIYRPMGVIIRTGESDSDNGKRLETHESNNPPGEFIELMNRNDVPSSITDEDYRRHLISLSSKFNACGSRANDRSFIDIGNAITIPKIKVILNDSLDEMIEHYNKYFGIKGIIET